MTRKSRILFDPTNFEVVEDTATMVADYNASEPNRGHLHINEQEQENLNDMFLEAGLLNEASIH